MTPNLAIVESNTLAALGLKHLLEDAMPMVNISTFGTFGEFLASNPDRFMHYFVSMHIVLSHRNFFIDDNRRHHTIVLTTSNDPNSQLAGFHCICACVSEPLLIQELVSLQRKGHPRSKHLPTLGDDVPTSNDKALSDREREVLSLVAQGKINKEIADQLCIGLTTVITHRKKIQEKLGIKTVSALTIYAVTHGYIDINKI